MAVGLGVTVTWKRAPRRSMPRRRALPWPAATLRSKSPQLLTGWPSTLTMRSPTSTPAAWAGPPATSLPTTAGKGMASRDMPMRYWATLSPNRLVTWCPLG